MHSTQHERKVEQNWKLEASLGTVVPLSLLEMYLSLLLFSINHVLLALHSISEFLSSTPPLGHSRLRYFLILSGLCEPETSTTGLYWPGINYDWQSCFSNAIVKYFSKFKKLGVKPVKNGRSMRFYHPWLTAPAARQFIDVKYKYQDVWRQILKPKTKHLWMWNQTIVTSLLQFRSWFWPSITHYAYAVTR